MTLREEAVNLSKTLNLIVKGLQCYRESSYATNMAKVLAPIVARYDEAVFIRHSRDVAASAIAELREHMHNVNGAATKGDLQIVAGPVLDRYWELQSIFQELKYRDEQI